LTAGLISFVPYLGAIFGIGSAVSIAVYQFWPEWPHVVLVAAVFVTGQLVQDYVLTPRLIGNQIGLHPLWVIFGVLAGGALFGFVGILLAVPACAVIGVLLRFGFTLYKQSSLYAGDGD
jgi:predicted PurR-regulated permease PerM